MKESIHRLAKVAADSGSAHSFEDAEASLKLLKLNVFVGEDIVTSSSLHDTFDTIISSLWNLGAEPNALNELTKRYDLPSNL